VINKRHTQEKMRLHALVHGRVQGVGFRAYTQHEAVSLQLSGWVRNNSDGTVEVIAEGRKTALERFLHYLQTGPSYASVTQVESSWGHYSGEFVRFSIRYY
jgi:acylphosphatase